MMVESTNLVGLAEVADALGVGRSVVVNWAVRYTSFPAPVTRLRCGPIYELSAVVTWHRQYEDTRKAITRAISR